MRGADILNKKKIILGAATFVIAIFIVGCSKGSNPANASNTSTDNTKKREAKGDTSKQTVDGLTLSASAKIGAVKGNRSKDNVADDNGEYIADGSDIVKAADYKSIIVDIDIKNDSDRVADLSQLYVVLQDGYKLNSTITGIEKDIQIQAKISDRYESKFLVKKDIQVQAKTAGKYEFKFLLKKDIKTEKLNFNCEWIKNNDEFQKLKSTDPSIHYPPGYNKDIFESIGLSCDIKN
jgi:hypothetical protein